MTTSSEAFRASISLSATEIHQAASDHGVSLEIRGEMLLYTYEQ